MDLQKFDPALLDYSKLDQYKQLLQKLDLLERNSYEIFDLYKKDHLHFTSSFETMLGYNRKKAFEEGIDYVNSFIHPEDLERLFISGNYFLKFGIDLDPEERKDYKLSNDFRIKNAQKKYVRVIKQYSVLENDPLGNVWLSLGVINISPDDDTQKPVRSKMINNKTGEIFYFPFSDDAIQKSPISEREIQVLELISKGLPSKSIAEKLFISVHTVNTHRQRIIEKMEVGNTGQAISRAIEMNLI